MGGGLEERGVAARKGAGRDRPAAGSRKPPVRRAVERRGKLESCSSSLLMYESSSRWRDCGFGSSFSSSSSRSTRRRLPDTADRPRIAAMGGGSSSSSAASAEPRGGHHQGLLPCSSKRRHLFLGSTFFFFFSFFEREREKNGSTRGSPSKVTDEKRSLSRNAPRPRPVVQHPQPCTA